MNVRHLIMLLFGVASAARLLVASPGPPLAPGEELKYSVSWAIVPGAGQIVVSAQSSEPEEIKITTNTSTRGLARLLLPFKATAESVYDVNTGALRSLHDWSQTRGKHAEHIVNFDYPTHRATYVVVGATTPRFLEMPDGAPSDLISALLDTRRWDLKPGEARDSLVLFNDEFYLLTIHAARYETVDTDLGTFQTLVLEPRMEKTPPKGMFAKGSTVRVWISQDERRLPVKFEVEFKIGTGVATLESYTPPPGTAPTPGNVVVSPRGPRLPRADGRAEGNTTSSTSE